MLCQKCQKNEATIHLYANVGGERKQLDYCQSCYQELKAHQQNLNNPTNQGTSQDSYGFGSIDDWFRALSQQINAQQKNPSQIPPTQNNLGGTPPRGPHQGGPGRSYRNMV